jgi:transposase-like protein
MLNELKCPQCGHENSLLTKYLRIRRICTLCGSNLEDIPGYEETKREHTRQLGQTIGVLIGLLLFIIAFVMGLLLQAGLIE